jgi:glycosyltransferase involved in cell wall biosynthesis
MHNPSFDRTGWPMEYTESMIAPRLWAKKENIIVFPHRIAPEKRLDLFERLANHPDLRHYDFVVPMKMNVDKTDYHKWLQRARFAVSFAEQETLGISMYEAACAGACPIVPNRLSYTEMYDPMFKRADSIRSAVNAILEYEQQEMSEPIAQLVNKLHNNYFSATRLINKLKEYNERTK